MAFSEDSRERRMFGEYYRLCEKYWNFTFAQRNDDALWDRLIDDVDEFNRKFDTEEDHFAEMLTAALIQHASDQSNGKPRWCVPGTDGAIGALLRKLMEG